MAENKVLGWYILHYGKEYLDASLASIAPFCDKIVILYSPQASQGHPTDLRCPDSKEELRAIAYKYNAEWHEVLVGNEGEHTGKIYEYSNGYDILLRADADEIFDDLPKALEEVAKGDKRYYGVRGFKHFWKSFSNILTDGYTPVRFCKPSIKEETFGQVDCRVYHFGYCQNIETIKYKLKVTGHFDEIRPEWLSLYENWKPTDEFLHPVSRQIWGKVEPFDKNTLPDILKQHPNFNKESI